MKNDPMYAGQPIRDRCYKASQRRLNPNIGRGKRMAAAVLQGRRKGQKSGWEKGQKESSGAAGEEDGEREIRRWWGRRKVGRRPVFFW